MVLQKDGRETSRTLTLLTVTRTQGKKLILQPQSNTTRTDRKGSRYQYSVYITVLIRLVFMIDISPSPREVTNHQDFLGLRKFCLGRGRNAIDPRKTVHSTV